MKKLIVLAIIGFSAQLIDGSLGMAYGVTSTSLLLAFGVAPAFASASVHLAEVVTTAASGISHMKWGNIDRGLVKGLMIPGTVGAFLGACFLSRLPGQLVKPYVAAFLFCLGAYVLSRFLFWEKKQKQPRQQKAGRWLLPLGFVAGFADSTGGGGWGPLTTPVLLAKDGMETRKVIGSVDTCEFAIATAATLGFFISLGWDAVIWPWVIALMIGGIVAAPIAAWLVHIIPSHLLGVMVGGLILFTNTQILVKSIPAVTPFWPWIYAGIGLVWAASFVYALWIHRGKQRGEG
ncbi:sulfite exporter TauE/SafE family protein [Marinithermofilum abyssi]|nr:sulfite exporter TauE/SafE family protein [Marinithermofilum abyssi]